MKLGIDATPLSAGRTPIMAKLEKMPKEGGHTHQVTLFIRDEDYGENRFWRIGRVHLNASEGKVEVASIVHLRPLLVDERDHEANE